MDWLWRKINQTKVKEPGTPKFGRGVSARNIYTRHAQKASGAIGSGSQISSALISERGLVQSEALGEDLREKGGKQGKGLKMGTSNQKRTGETGRAVEKGFGSDPEAYKPRVAFELGFSHVPEDFNKLFIEKWDANKRDLMIERGLILADADAAAVKAAFNALSPSGQADIAETAESPVMEEWLNESEGELAKMYSLEDAAAHLAPLVQRDRKSVSRFFSGSEVNRLRVTHKTVMEPLLMKILVLPNGEKPKTLSDIGGQMGLNDGWELRNGIDAEGKEVVRVFMNRVEDRSEDEPEYVQTEYGIDLEELERLAKLGVEIRKASEQ